MSSSSDKFWKIYFNIIIHSKYFAISDWVRDSLLTDGADQMWKKHSIHSHKGHARQRRCFGRGWRKSSQLQPRLRLKMNGRNARLVYVIGLRAVQFRNNWTKKSPTTDKIRRDRRQSPFWLGGVVTVSLRWLTSLYCLLYFQAFDWLRPTVLFFLNWIVCLFVKESPIWNCYLLRF